MRMTDQRRVGQAQIHLQSHRLVRPAGDSGQVGQLVQHVGGDACEHEALRHEYDDAFPFLRIVRTGEQHETVA